MTSTTELDPLVATWARLPGALEGGNPFVSPAWLQAWLQHRGAGTVPKLVAPDELTIAPFGEIRRGPLRIWRLLGHEDSDFAGLLSAGSSTDAWDRVFRELARRRGEWDLLHLHSVPDAPAILEAAARHLGVTAKSREYERCPAVRMSPSWDEFLRTHKKLKYEIRRWAKRLEEQGPVAYEITRPPIGETHARTLEDVERDSWKWTHGNPMFRAGSQREFLLSAMADPALPAHLWLLRVGGEVAAVSLVLEGERRWFYYLATFRDRFRNAGALLMAHIVEDAHRAGCTSVSLLRGDHGYKEAWSDFVEPVHEVIIPSGLRGRVAAATFQLRWRAARSATLHRLRARLFAVGDRRARATDD